MSVSCGRWFVRLRAGLLVIVALLAFNVGAAVAAPIINVTGTCDTLGNSTFTIKNTGSAMTVDFTWEIYQNATFLTSGPFRLTAAGAPGDNQQLTINGLYGTIEVRVKDQNNAPVSNASAFCIERASVTINQASGQADPASTQPILFTATFSKPVTGFTGTDVIVTGMAGTPGIVVTDSGDHMNYTVAITGLADQETATVRVPIDAALDATGLGNKASTSTDNKVTYRAPPVIGVTGSCDNGGNSQFTIANTGGAMTVNYTWEIYQNSVFLTSGQFMLTANGTPTSQQQLTINGLYGTLEVRIKNQSNVQIASASAVCVQITVTIDQAATQADPTNSSPILFDVVFSMAVAGFQSNDVLVTGMAATPGITVTDVGDHRHFTVAVTGAASGETIRATVRAGAASPGSTAASTSTDNSVTYDTSRSITAIAVDPNDPMRIYSSQFGGGIWRSSNGGDTWSAATTQPTNLWATALVIDPSLSTRLYAATRSGGVFKSTTSAASWAPCSNTGLGSPRVVSMTITAAGRLFAGTEAGVFASNDCGVWTGANTGLPNASLTPVNALLVDPAATSPVTLYAGIDGAGIFKSVNGGGQWTAASTQPANLRIKALAIKPGSSAIIYAATFGGGVFVSNNSGAAWTTCATQPANLNARSLTIDPVGMLYVGTDAGVFVSSDACASWTAMNAGLPL